MTEKVSLQDLRRLLEKRPRLPNPFDYEFDTEETLEWFREFVEAFNQFEKRLKTLLKKNSTFPEMVITNALCCARFPNCQGCKEKCAIERWIKLEDLEKVLGKKSPV